MSLAALKPSFDIDFAGRAAPRESAEITTLFPKSDAPADSAVGETFGGKLGYSVIAAYALFNLAFAITHFAI